MTALVPSTPILRSGCAGWAAANSGGLLTIRFMASKDLSACWGDAMAATPSDWRLMGVACGPREVEPKVHSADKWCAWARGPDRERLEGRGTGPLDALLELTVKLRELSR